MLVPRIRSGRWSCSESQGRSADSAPTSYAPRAPPPASTSATVSLPATTPATPLGRGPADATTVDQPPAAGKGGTSTEAPVSQRRRGRSLRHAHALLPSARGRPPPPRRV